MKKNSLILLQFILPAFFSVCIQASQSRADENNATHTPICTSTLDVFSKIYGVDLTAWEQNPKVSPFASKTKENTSVKIEYTSGGFNITETPAFPGRSSDFHVRLNSDCKISILMDVATVTKSGAKMRTYLQGQYCLNKEDPYFTSAGAFIDQLCNQSIPKELLFSGYTHATEKPRTPANLNEIKK